MRDLAALALLALCLAGCNGMRREVPEQVDAELIRTEVGLPADASLLSLHRNVSTGGTFGREGLRIVARFRLAAVPSGPDWSPLPLPPPVGKLRLPPSELPALERGSFLCHLEVWETGQTYRKVSCAAPEGTVHRYRIAVYDPATRTVTAVLQNYY